VRVALNFFGAPKTYGSWGFQGPVIWQRRDERTYSVTAALLLFGFSTLSQTNGWRPGAEIPTPSAREPRAQARGFFCEQAMTLQNSKLNFFSAGASYQ
jgi:hypothetical protein